MRIFSLISVFFLSLMLAGCGDAAEEVSEPTAVRPTIAVTTTVTTLGPDSVYAVVPASAVSSNAANVSPTRSGVMQQVLVSIGQKVTSNQILGYLDPAGSSGEASAQLAESKAAASSASASATYTATVQQQTIAASEQSLSSALSGVEAAKARAESALAGSESAIRSACDAAWVGLDQGQEEIKDTNTVLDQLFGITTKYEHIADSIASSLGANSPGSRGAAEASSLVAYNAFTDWEAAHTSTADCPTDTELSSFIAVLKDMQSALSQADTALQFSVASGSFPQSDIDSYETKIEAAYATTIARRSNLEATRTSLAAAITQDAAVRAENAANISQAEASVAAAQADLIATKANAEKAISQANASLEQANANVQRTISSTGRLAIRAPFAGRVADVLVDAGEPASTGQVLFVIAGDDTVDIEAFVSEKLWRLLSVGKEVNGTSFFGDTFKATLRERAPTASSTSQSFKVIFEVTEGAVVPGGTVTLRLPSTSLDAVTRLPAEAATVQPNGGYAVFSVGEGGVVSQIPVQLAARDGEDLLLTGIPNATTVVVQGALRLIEGDTVSVYE